MSTSIELVNMEAKAEADIVTTGAKRHRAIKGEVDKEEGKK